MAQYRIELENIEGSDDFCGAMDGDAEAVLIKRADEVFNTPIKIKDMQAGDLIRLCPGWGARTVKAAPVAV